MRHRKQLFFIVWNMRKGDLCSCGADGLSVQCESAAI